MLNTAQASRILYLKQRLQALDDEMVGLEAEFGAEDNRVRNLLHYMALRRHDLREIQQELASLGLSSLGRTESHVRTSIAAILRILTHLCGDREDRLNDLDPAGPSLPEARQRLELHTEELLGPAPAGRRVRIMVTVPSDAATDYLLVRQLLESGMNCMRINCAHDGPDSWAAMIRHLRRAEAETGLRSKIEMDLAGPKLRTGPVEPGPAVLRLHPQRDPLGRVIAPASLWLTPARAPEPPPDANAAVLPLPARWIARLKPGHRVRFVDSRGAKRQLFIRERIGTNCSAEISHTAYVTPGTILTAPTPPGAAPATARIGPLPPIPQALLLEKGDTLILTLDLTPGRPAQRDPQGRIVSPARIGVTLPDFFTSVQSGEPIWFDDGKIGGVIETVAPHEVAVRIIDARPGGDKLAAEKGINIPATDLRTPALTDADSTALEFVVAHADIVGFSFVRTAEDVRLMRDRLTALGHPDLGLMLKIETQGGFENLPLILIEAMRGPAVGVMIARGDLAVECGFERLAEIQEEILWIAESASVPVVWATQVLETMAKTGRPSRSEITDAAMGERAECVMLNKGPFIVDAVKALDNVLRRMEAHQEKKTARLRKLRVATAFAPNGAAG